MRLISILFTSFILVSCAGLYPTPPASPSLDHQTLSRFYQVDPQGQPDGNHQIVYRSAQPNDSDWKFLVVKYGITIEIKLNGIESFVKPPSLVKTYDESINVEIEPSKEFLDRVLDEIDHAKGPVLIHCTHGEDRTGLIIALWRIRHKVLIEEVYKDMIWNGFHPYRGLWKAWARRAGW